MVTTRGRRVAAPKAKQEAKPAKKTLNSDDEFDSPSIRSMDEDSVDFEEDDDDLELIQKVRKTSSKSTKTKQTRKQQKMAAPAKKKFADSSDSDSDEDSIVKRKPQPKRKSPPRRRVASTKKFSDFSDDEKSDSSIDRHKKCPPKKTTISKQQSDNESDNSDSDSDEIARKLNAGNTRRRIRPCQKRDTRINDSSSSEEDEEDDKENENSSSSDEDISDVQPGKRPRFAVRLALRNKKQKLQQAAKKSVRGVNTMLVEGDDSDSGSDVEIVEYSKKPGRRAPAKLNESIEESSDEEEKRPKTKAVANNKAGLDFSKAKEMLQSAQNYHAEDLDVAAPEPAPVASVRASAVAAQTTASVSSTVGPRINVRLLSREIQADGSKSEPKDEIFSIQQGEPMQNLLQQYKAKHNLIDDSTAITMEFDGEKIAWDRTPKSYEMENEDLLHVLLKRSQGRPIRVKLRNEKQEERVFQIRTMEPLKNLMDKYIGWKKIPSRQQSKLSFRFDGESLSLASNAADYDMEDDELIDVCIKK